MKKQRQEFVEDVESLLEETTLQESAEMVWKIFEKSLENIDADSLVLLRQYFEGKTVKELSKARHLPEKDVQAWLEKIKREVLGGIRNESSVRQ